MKRFMGKAAGLSRAQLTRLIGQRAKTGRLVGRRVGAPAKPFVRRYTARDVVLPAQVDETLGQVCGQATRPVHQFARTVLSPHLNFPRPCLFATAVADANGKTRKVYRDRAVATPYERLKSLDRAERFLKAGVSFATLDAQAHAVSDLESARRVHRERDRLLRAIRAVWPSAA